MTHGTATALATWLQTDAIAYVHRLISPGDQGVLFVWDMRPDAFHRLDLSTKRVRRGYSLPGTPEPSLSSHAVLWLALHEPAILAAFQRHIEAFHAAMDAPPYTYAVSINPSFASPIEFTLYYTNSADTVEVIPATVAALQRCIDRH